MRRRDLLAALAAGGVAVPGSASAAQPKVLRLAFNTPETGFDPPQISDLNSSSVADHIFESPLVYDYLARPAKLRARTAVALPEVSRDYKTWTYRIRPGIRFTDDAAFKGEARELTVHDYVYAIKRYYDPKAESIYVPTACRGGDAHRASSSNATPTFASSASRPRCPPMTPKPRRSPLRSPVVACRFASVSRSTSSKRRSRAGWLSRTASTT